MYEDVRLQTWQREMSKPVPLNNGGKCHLVWPSGAEALALMFAAEPKAKHGKIWRIKGSKNENCVAVSQGMSTDSAPRKHQVSWIHRTGILVCLEELGENIGFGASTCTRSADDDQLKMKTHKETDWARLRLTRRQKEQIHWWWWWGGNSHVSSQFIRIQERVASAAMNWWD